MERRSLQKLIQELERRSALAKKTPSLLSCLFEKQRAVLSDPADRVCVDAGRRSGKTHLGGVWAYTMGLAHPRSWVPIIETTSTCMAAQVMWQHLSRLNEDYELGLSPNRIEKTFTLPNHTVIQLVGADQTRLADRLRGAPFAGVLIDEAGSFRPSVLEYLMTDVIDPALLDRQGKVLMVGTPGIVPLGPFYTACHGAPGWSHHHWTCMQNPHLPHAAEYLGRLRTEKGWAEDEPAYLREWLGEWVHDPSQLVYCFDPNKNRASEPLQNARHVIGLDLGFQDSTAFVVMAYDNYGNVQVVESWKRPGLIPSAVAVQVEKLMKRYKTDLVVADTGGIGKAYAEEMRIRYALPIIAAQKTNKFAYIELMNGDLRSGRQKFVVDNNRDLIEELSLLQWADRYKQQIDDRYEDHLCDALLYAWRYCTQSVGRWEEEAPKPGSKEYFRKLEDEMWEESSGSNKQWWAQ